MRRRALLAGAAALAAPPAAAQKYPIGTRPRALSFKGKGGIALSGPGGQAGEYAQLAGPDMDQRIDIARIETARPQFIELDRNHFHRHRGASDHRIFGNLIGFGFALIPTYENAKWTHHRNTIPTAAFSSSRP